MAELRVEIDFPGAIKLVNGFVTGLTKPRDFALKCAEADPTELQHLLCAFDAIVGTAPQLHKVVELVMLRRGISTGNAGSISG